MNTLFDPNGSFMSALRKLADIVFCNLLFCLFSIPFFTTGAALTALYASMQLLVTDTDDEDKSAVRVFLRSFKANFRQATALWLIDLALILFLGMYYMIVETMTGPAARIYKVTFFVLVLLFLLATRYIFPIVARYNLSTRDVIRDGLLASAGSLPWTLLTILIPVVLVYVTVFMNPDNFSIAVFLWLTVGAGVVCYVNSFVIMHVFRRSGLEKTPDPVEKEEYQTPEEADRDKYKDWNSRN